MPRRADSCARDRTARALTRPALALFFGGGARSTAGFWVGDYGRAGARECTRSPAFRNREIADWTKETVVSWFIDDSHYFGDDARYVFQRMERGASRSRLRAFSPLVSSRGDISSSTRPPITPSYHAVLASASPFSARKKERSRRSARRRTASIRRFIRWLRVASPAAAPASASLPCPRARRRQAPSSCPPPGRPRPSAKC